MLSLLFYYHNYSDVINRLVLYLMCVYVSIFHSCSHCNWSLGCWVSTQIDLNWIELNWIDLIFFIFTVCILLCVTTIWLGNVSVNTTRKMISKLKSISEFCCLPLHVSVLMGPSTGSVYNKYDKVNLNLHVDSYCGVTRPYYKSSKSCRKLWTCVMMKITV
jgi:hypothetical protein